MLNIYCYTTININFLSGNNIIGKNKETQGPLIIKIMIPITG